MSLVNLKFRTKILLLVVANLFIFCIVILVQFSNGQKSQKEEIEKNFKMYSSGLAETLSQKFYSIYHTVQAIAKNPAFEKKDVEKVKFSLNELVNLYQIYDMMIFVDLEGKIIASNNIAPDGTQLKTEFLSTIDFKQHHWFTQTKEGKLTNDVKKKIYGTYVGEVENDPLVSQIFGKSMYGMHFSTLITDAYSEPVGVLTTYANFGWVESELASLYQSLKASGKESSTITIINGQNKVLAQLDPELGTVDNLSRDLSRTILRNWSGTKIEKEDSAFLSSFLTIHNKKFIDEFGWSIYVKMLKKDAHSGIIAASNILYISITLAFITCLLFAFYFASQLPKKIQAMSSDLISVSKELNNISHDISFFSESITKKANDEIHSTQGTVASLNKMNIKITQNVTSADNATQFAVKVKNLADSANQLMNENLKSMENIAASNKKIERLVQTISEISKKLELLDEIVFKTSLLSFNASIEAGRAGAHGKGFAIVAEEVNMLAEQSGKTAHEISIYVKKCIDATKSVSKENDARVKEGLAIVQQVADSLNEISANASVLTTGASEVLSASKEQDTGIKEISQAMTDLDSITKENLKIAQEAIESSNSLKNYANHLKNLVDHLLQQLDGKKNVS